VRWTALVAWAVTSVTMYYTNVTLKPIVGLLAGGVLYAVLALAASRRTARDDVAASA
jgi:hypothetical protein